MEAIGYLPQDMSQMRWKCEHLALVQAQVGVWPGLWFPGSLSRDLSCFVFRPPTTCFAGTGSQASEDVVPRRLESQKEAKGSIPYPTRFSHSCLSVGVTLMPVIFHPTAWGWGVPIRWVILEKGLSVLHAQKGMSLTYFTIQNDWRQKSKIISIFKIFVLNTVVFSVEK